LPGGRQLSARYIPPEAAGLARAHRQIALDISVYLIYTYIMSYHMTVDAHVCAAGFDFRPEASAWNGGLGDRGRRTARASGDPRTRPENMGRNRGTKPLCPLESANGSRRERRRQESEGRSQESGVGIRRRGRSQRRPRGENVRNRGTKPLCALESATASRVDGRNYKEPRAARAENAVACLPPAAGYSRRWVSK